jgi:hypothetical protein
MTALALQIPVDRRPFAFESIACLVDFHFDNASFGIGPVKI